MDYLHTQKVGDIQVRYADLGSGAPVLLIHGLGGSIESWTNNIDELARTMRVIAIDLPGFGQSDKPKISYTVKFYRDFLVDFIDQIQIDKISVVGSSLGGHIAAEIAISHPELVEKLVLACPAGALPRSYRGSPALRRYVKVLESRTVQEVKKVLHTADNKAVDDSYARTVLEKVSAPGSKHAFLSALRGSTRAPRLTIRRLNRIKASTLLLWGKDDIMIPVRFAEPFVKMRNCRIVLLENCGHRPHAERSELFNRMVADFLLA
ncbi:MAG TPA: alpha/beta fold hydrolase [Nitrososphaera sp.]|nr:alpha/beta fold hydrolase [Nitrososphaera sp.]